MHAIGAEPENLLIDPAGLKPAQLQLGCSAAKRRRSAPQQSSLVATATNASAALLRLLQHHKSQGTKRLSLPSRGVHSAASQLAPMQPLSAVLGHSAALGICKCLPYELPSLANEPCDIDPASAGSLFGVNVTGAEQSDMYGVSTGTNTIRHPLMLYRSSTAAGAGRLANLPSSANIITGNAACHPFWHATPPRRFPKKHTFLLLCISLRQYLGFYNSSMWTVQQAGRPAWDC